MYWFFLGVDFPYSQIDINNLNNFNFLYLHLGIPIVHIEPGPYRVEYGQDITLACHITSNPLPYKLYWLWELNDETMITTINGNITWSPALFPLTEVTFEESGQYRCYAQNNLGIGKSNHVNLTVYGGV